MSATLLKNGKLLLHDGQDKTHPTQADLLIRGDRITQISPHIDAPDASIIDCTGKIISPGFVDTHHHLWQSCLKATHGDQILMDYFWTGLFINSFLSPADIFWSQLAGAMECIDGGTTTVVDHASVNYSQDHSQEALRATIASGVRSVFGYCPTARLAQWTPELELKDDLLAPWVMETFDQLARLNPFGSEGRVRLGFAFDGTWLPGPILQDMFARVRRAGAQLITTHSVYGTAFGAPTAPSPVATLNKHGLLGPDVLLSHQNNSSAEDAQAIQQNNVKVSCTPGTELQMGHGNPVCFEDGFQRQSSLGIDCHSVCSAYIPTQMMLALQWARGRRHETFEQCSKWAKSVAYTVEEAFNLGTIQGARAIRMEDEIGSLAVGKKADLVIFDAQSPGMLVAADRDPVAAIVLHSSVRDVETVIVDGIIRKKSGVLQPVSIPESISATENGLGGKSVSWKDIQHHLVRMSRAIDERKKTVVDGPVAQQGVLNKFHLNKEAWTDTL